MLKVRSSTAPIKSHIASEFAGSILQEEHRGYLHFRLPTASIPNLPSIFAVLERMKQNFDLEDYELTQTSLESIFCKFAQAQIEEDVKPKRKARKDARRTPQSALNTSTISTHTHVVMEPVSPVSGFLVDDDDDLLDLAAPRPMSMDLPVNLTADLDEEFDEDATMLS